MIKIALCYASKMIYDHVDLDVDSFFSFSRDPHGTRLNGIKLLLECCETARGCTSFQVELPRFGILCRKRALPLLALESLRDCLIRRAPWES